MVDRYYANLVSSMISVILATHNGEKVLPITLEAFTKLSMPRQKVEFIVIDNASSDESSRIIANYIQRLPLIHASEERLGKIFAIRKGLSLASGDFIVFTDDDVVPSTNWLLVLEKVAFDCPDYDVFLGAVRPFWLSTPPYWLAEQAQRGQVCGCTSVDKRSGDATHHDAKGAHMMVRKRVLASVGFRDDLWIADQALVGGEDTDFVSSALRAGYKAWFASEVEIGHIIREEEMSLSAVWCRQLRIGRSMVAADAKIYSCVTIFGYPRWMIPLLFSTSLRAALSFLRLRRSDAVVNLLHLARLCGQASQIRKGLHIARVRGESSS